MPLHRSRSAWPCCAALLAVLAGCETPAPVAPTDTPPPPPSATQTTQAPALAPPSGLASVDEKALDPSVSACDDFYQYACGGWLKSTPIPEDHAAWSRSFDVLDESNLAELRAILERYAGGQGKDEPYADKLGDFYTSCMDEAGIEKAGTAALKPVLDSIDKIKTPKDLAAVVGTLHTLGVHALFSFGSDRDAKDATQMIGRFEQGGLGLPEREYYLKNDEASKKLRAQYEEHVGKMLELLGEKPADAKAHAASVVAVETALAKASMTKEDRRDPQKTYHRLERAGLEKTAPEFAWGEYFAKLGAPDVTAINVAQPDFAKAIGEAMNATPILSCTDEPAPAAKEEPKGKKGEKAKAPAAKPCPKPAKKFAAADWKNYLRAQTVRSMAKTLPKAFVDEGFRFAQILTGAEKLPPRWKRCVRAADDSLGEALARPFVKKMLGDEGKAAVKDMVTAIEGAMSDNLDHLAWMDGDTRARAHEKLAAIANMIGYPDKWRNYDSLSIARGDYAGNRARATAFEVKRDLAKIGKPVDRFEWEMTPPSVNAYYEPSLNEMVFPAGILEPPFYSTKSTTATNLGSIGMVIGHELTHGFDDEGRQYDAKGNLRDWWAKPVSAEFDKRAACVEEQFNGYVATGDLHVNGKLTLGENIADLGGMRLAFAVLKKSLAGKPREAGPFTAEQQFFLGFAQAWCSNMRPQILSLLVKTNPHSPPRFRVNGPVSNMPEFAEAFQCKPESPMVRKNRCEVW